VVGRLSLLHTPQNASSSARDPSIFPSAQPYAGTILYTTPTSGAIRDIEKVSNDTFCIAGYELTSDTYTEDIVIAKVNDSGGILWSRTWGASLRDRPERLFVDEEENLYMAGYSYDPSLKKSKAVVLKYDPCGNLLWDLILDLGVSYGSKALGVHVDGSQNVFISGFRFQETFLGTYPSLFAGKIDPGGNLIWITSGGHTSLDAGVGDDIVRDGEGNLYVISYSPPQDVGLVKFDPQGRMLWIKTWDKPNDHVWPNSILLDNASGYLYVSGYSVQSGIFLVKFDLNGQMVEERFGLGGAVSGLNDFDRIQEGGQLRVFLSWGSGDRLLFPSFHGVYKTTESTPSVLSFSENAIHEEREVHIDSLGEMYFSCAIEINNTFVAAGQSRGRGVVIRTAERIPHSEGSLPSQEHTSGSTGGSLLYLMIGSAAVTGLYYCMKKEFFKKMS